MLGGSGHCQQMGGHLCSLSPSWGLPWREAQCMGLGPGFFVPHLTPVVSDPMPISCVGRVDGILSWGMGG